MNIREFKKIIDTIYKIDPEARLKSEVIHADGRIVEIDLSKNITKRQYNRLLSLDIRDYFNDKTVANIGLTDYEIKEIQGFYNKQIGLFFYT